MAKKPAASRRKQVPGALIEHERPAPTGPKVRAIRLGYYNEERKREGDVFRLNKNEDFSEKWMERVNEQERERKTGAQDALNMMTSSIRETTRDPLGADR